MRQTNRAFSPREINLGMWVIVGALLISAAGVIANSLWLTPSLGRYGDMETQHASSGALDARPLVDARMQTVAVSATAAANARVASAG